MPAEDHIEINDINGNKCWHRHNFANLQPTAETHTKKLYIVVDGAISSVISQGKETLGLPTKESYVLGALSVRNGLIDMMEDHGHTNIRVLNFKVHRQDQANPTDSLELLF